MKQAAAKQVAREKEDDHDHSDEDGIRSMMTKKHLNQPLIQQQKDSHEHKQ